MAHQYVVETIPSTRAKAEFRELLDTVAHDHHPRLIDRYGRGAVAMMEPEALVALVEDAQFETEVVVEVDAVSVTLPQVGIIGFGPTFDAAIEDTLEKVREYATRYLDNRAFYAQTNRAHEYRLLTKFAFTPISEQRALLFQEAVPAAREAAAARP